MLNMGALCMCTRFDETFNHSNRMFTVSECRHKIDQRVGLGYGYLVQKVEYDCRLN